MSIVKKCHIDIWYDNMKREQNNRLDSHLITEDEYRKTLRRLAWEYWERLERVNSGEN